MAQHLIMTAYANPDLSILVTRKTFPSLRITAYKFVLDLLDEYDLPYELNRSEHVVRLSNKSEFLFKSLDEPEKIKSAEFNIVWVEEATEITLDDFRQLNLRLRRKGVVPNRMYLTCNPISRLSWVYTELVEKKRDDVEAYTSTYKDNRFLAQDYITQLEGLATQDENYYKVYCLGEWGILRNLVYTNWTLVDTIPENPDDVAYGLDFGFNNPTALVEITVKDQVFYIRELLYQTKLTNTDLIDRLNSLIPDKERSIYPDSAEPARIELFNAGFNAKPARKHADSAAKKGVTEGIDFVKRHRLHITRDSVNLLKEISGYKWREDKDGRILDEPVKFNDHILDALRYGMVSHFKKQGGTTYFEFG